MTENDLMTVLLDVAEKKSVFDAYARDAIVAIAKRRGLLEQKPTAKEKWEVFKQAHMNWISMSPFESQRWFIEMVELADRVIKEAEEKK